MPASVTWLVPGHADTADLAVVIVSLNVKDLLLENLRVLMRSVGSIKAELFVVDNASLDGTPAAVAAEFPQATLIANVENRGFARANAQALERARTRHVLLLNPDMRVDADALQKTVEYLDKHPETGVVGGRLRKEDGSVLRSVRRFPTVWSQLVILLKLPHVFPSINDRYLYQGFDFDREQAVDSVRGSYFAIRENVFHELGGLDTRYFVWFEEVDYCRQAAKRGWRVMHVPTIGATDYVGRAFIQRKRMWTQYHFTRSMTQYFFKWEAWWQGALLSLARPFGLIGAACADAWAWMKSL